MTKPTNKRKPIEKPSFLDKARSYIVPTILSVIALALTGRELSISNEAEELYQKGNDLEQKGLYTEALFYYRNALIYNPNHARARFSLGSAYAYFEEYDAAQEELNRLGILDNELADELGCIIKNS